MIKFENFFYVTIILCGLSFIGIKVYSYFENPTKSQDYSNMPTLSNDLISEIDQNSTTSVSLTKINIQQKTIDLGKLKKGDTAEFNFVISNEGDHNLILNNVEPECHCTIANWEKSAIKPGESTMITATYDTSYPGHFQKLVTVEANTPDSPFILILRGNVVDE